RPSLLLLSLCPSPCPITPAYAPLLLSPRPLPTSPLFPYTTLFRSATVAAVGVGAVSRCDTVVASMAKGNSHTCGCSCASLSSFRDRKSTRLNSSHQIISYAVFCLKKKKKTKRYKISRTQKSTYIRL